MATARLLVIVLSLVSLSVFAQRSKSASDFYVDNTGVIRWGKAGSEVQGFGVNYTVPFAHAYQVAKQLNVPIEKAIDDDVYHFARLGFDLYRVHMWDTEITDTLGNLLDNEHLRLFDYTVMKMKERGMKFIITPIAYWGNGWPAPDQKTHGFSHKYGKDACLTNPDAIKAQQTYLYQLLNHVNAYTKTAYKNDPDIIAFEICNEPHHRGTETEVTTFINSMVSSMRNTGCKKPIFYNITHSIHLENAYFNANIQGGTFQWYPTGLGFRHELSGNLLPNVDRYTVPFAANPKFKPMARIVYEFDAADVGRSYIYPAMARSFREAGMQLATHFSYDPTYMAFANTEYGTHYMNLVYTPQKALALKLAGEVFHTIPRYKSFGRYPDNTSFDGFKVSYEHDLTELTTEKKFIYTNHTNTIPATDKLEHISGSGNSPLVKYEGTGAYFLDKIASGVWRLEVMPDAIWIHDPFERTSLKKEVAVINWRSWPMTIALSDLGADFAIKAVNEGNTFSGQANHGTFMISPGSYLITRSGVVSAVKPDDRLGKILIKEFAAPKTSVSRARVLHSPSTEITSGKNYEVKATIVTKNAPQEVELHVWAGFRPEVLKMEKGWGYEYKAIIPDRLVREGFLNYYITIKDDDVVYTYPSGIQSYPRDWDFYDATAYKVRVVSASNPVYLFNANTDSDWLVRQWIRGLSVVPVSDPDRAEVVVNVEKLFSVDPENKAGEKIHDYSFRYFFGKRIKGREHDLAGKQELIVKGRSLNDKPCKLQVALIMNDGSTVGGILTLQPGTAEHVLKISELSAAKHVTLPRPYPTFLPYYVEGSRKSVFDLTKIESLQFSIGPGIPTEELNDKHGVAIESVKLR